MSCNASNKEHKPWYAGDGAYSSPNSFRNGMSNILYMLNVSMSDVLAVYVGMWPSICMAKNDIWPYCSRFCLFLFLFLSVSDIYVLLSESMSGLWARGSLFLDLDLSGVFTDERCMSKGPDTRFKCTLVMTCNLITTLIYEYSYNTHL